MSTIQINCTVYDMDEVFEKLGFVRKDKSVATPDERVANLRTETPTLIKDEPDNFDGADQLVAAETMPTQEQVDAAAVRNATVEYVAQDDELDNDEIPWDERIHSSNKKKSAKGFWMRRRNLQDPYYHQIVAELKGDTGNNTVTVPVPTPPPETVVPTPPPAATADVQVPTAVEVSEQQVMERITLLREKKLIVSQAELDANPTMKATTLEIVMAKSGLDNFGQIFGAAPDVLQRVWSTING